MFRKHVKTKRKAGKNVAGMEISPRRSLLKVLQQTVASVLSDF